jgi:hypothetical protein
VASGAPSPAARRTGTVSRASMTGDLSRPRTSGTWTRSRSSSLRKGCLWTTWSSSRASTRWTWCTAAPSGTGSRPTAIRSWTGRTAQQPAEPVQLQPVQTRAARRRQPVLIQLQLLQQRVPQSHRTP